MKFKIILDTGSVASVGVVLMTSISSAGGGALVFLLNNLQMMAFFLFFKTYMPSHLEMIIRGLESFNIMLVLPNPG